MPHRGLLLKQNQLLNRIEKVINLHELLLNLSRYLSLCALVDKRFDILAILFVHILMEFAIF